MVRVGAFDAAFTKLLWSVVTWQTNVQCQAPSNTETTPESIYFHLSDLTRAFSPLTMEHTPQNTRLHSALSCPAVSIFLQLNLKPAVHISTSRSLFQVFLSRRLSPWPCGIHCSTCLAMLSLLRLSVCPIQFHFLLWSCSKTQNNTAPKQTNQKFQFDVTRKMMHGMLIIRNIYRFSQDPTQLAESSTEPTNGAITTKISTKENRKEPTDVHW